MNEHVILVDEQDNATGTMDKLQAHLFGKLHRAFSVFIFNNSGELLLQQRAFEKYHSGGLWSNTCCSHPCLGEETLAAAQRRLLQEMGLVCNLSYQFNFIYREQLDNGITEYEFDHVYFGVADVEPQLNLKEAVAFKYMSMKDLGSELKQNPGDYSKWLKICYPQVVESFNNYLRI